MRATPEWFGDDPGHEPDETWVTLARRRGRTELARIALIRALDDIGTADTDELPWIIEEFTALGDLRQAVRAQRLHARLQDTDRNRATAYIRLAALERRHGDLDGASASLGTALRALGVAPAPEPDAVDQPPLFETGPADTDARAHRTDSAVAVDLTREYYELARKAAECDRAALARHLLTTASALLSALARPLPPVLLRAAHSAALTCKGAEPADRCATVVTGEEQRIAVFPHDGDDDAD
ncbi:hypothetical protein ABT298_17525 [Streptomyces sp. NPDC001034]|uniref:hypothetical protein n=1 Tax=Streptomyces sp. NPDC001034 TaxID=3154375 RepID=UPI00332E3C30